MPFSFVRKTTSSFELEVRYLGVFFRSVYYLFEKFYSYPMATFLRNYSILLLVLFFSFSELFSQGLVSRVDPPHWWTKMKNHKLQLLLYGDDLSDLEVNLHHHHGIHLQDRIHCDDPNYMILNFEIGKHLHGEQTFVLDLKKGEQKEELTYKLLERNESRPQGLEESDLVYYIEPGKFFPEGSFHGSETTVDYLNDLGVTGIWFNPLQEMIYSSGKMGLRDHYLFERDFGKIDDFKGFTNASKVKGQKLVLDIVSDQISKEHPFAKNTPFKKWINPWNRTRETNFEEAITYDPYSSEFDKKKFSEGWMDSTLVDLNGRDPLLARYLIQNSLWWIEEYQFDAIRFLNYPYQDEFFMKQWAGEILSEYPSIFMIADARANTLAGQAYFLGDQGLHKNFDNRIHSLMDYQLASLFKGLVVEGGNSENRIAPMFHHFSQDFIYDHPDKLITFFDEGKGNRFFFSCQQDFEKYKMGMVMLTTLRGIPKIDYGSEFLLKSSKSPLGDKFLAQGRNGIENEAFDLTKKLANFRKDHKGLFEGKMVQFLPKDGLYVYFRYTRDEELMVMVNASYDTVDVSLDRYKERFHGFVDYKEILSGVEGHFGQDFKALPWETRVYYFEKRK